MIPRLIASAPRLTRILRPTAARAITSQRRIPSLLSSTLSSPSATLSKSCSCVGSSTLAAACTDENHIMSSSSSCARSTISQQHRNNSISVSAAATLLGHYPGSGTVDPSAEHHYGPLDDGGSSSSSLVDENSLLRTLKRINDGAGRRKNKSSRAAKKTDATLESLASVKEMLADLALTQQQQPVPAATAMSSRTVPKLESPTLDVARSMPLSCRQMDNTSLMCLAALDVVEARSEVLRRHIMDTDSVSYEEACQTYDEIRDYNSSALSAVHTIPYKIAIATATIAAFASIPLCFHLPSVEYFNANFVNLDVPEPDHLKTWLGVGAFSWEWMEPPLGQLSFMILCLQVARNQLGTIGHKPYGGFVRQWRAERLRERYPQYDEQILMSYSKSTPLIGR